MSDKYLDKKITFEDGKLYCNGQEISIEEAEEIIKNQIKELEKNKEEIIQKEDNLDEDRTRMMVNDLNEVFVYASNSGIHVRGNNEYYEAGDLILKAELICDKALRIFSPEYRKEKRKEDLEKNDPLKEIISNFDWGGIEPTNIEIIEKSIEMYIASIVIIEMRKQFYNIDFNFEKDDIRVYLDLPLEIRIYIIKDSFSLYFRINRNIFTDTIPFNFIVSSMTVNTFKIQDDISILANQNNSNNIKFAQTIENAVFKEIRFLKNLIKEEIDYSLSMNISKAKERLNLANKILETYKGLLSEELLTKLNNLIKETENYQDVLYEEIKEEKEEKIDISSIIYDNLSKTFNVDKEKIIREISQSNNKYEINILGQKISININDNDNVIIKSVNIVGNSKNDIVNKNVIGKNINDKLRKAVNYSYLPIIYRTIDNLIKDNKVLENRKKIKEIEGKLKDLIIFIYEDFDTYENIEFLKEKINNILDTVSIINQNIAFEIFSIIDFILFKSLEKLHIKDINILNFRNKLSLSYKEFYSINNDFFETTIEIKNLINRILNIVLLIKEITVYLENIFDISIENSIKELANVLIEDYICNKLCRNLLSLLDISDTLKDDSFKFQIKNIMLEFISVIS